MSMYAAENKEEREKWGGIDLRTKISKEISCNYSWLNKRLLKASLENSH